MNNRTTSNKAAALPEAPQAEAPQAEAPKLPPTKEALEALLSSLPEGFQEALLASIAGKAEAPEAEKKKAAKAKEAKEAKPSGFQKALAWGAVSLAGKSFCLEAAFQGAEGQKGPSFLVCQAASLTALLCQRQAFSVAWKKAREGRSFVGTRLTEAEPGDKPYKLTASEGEGGYSFLLFVRYKEATDKALEGLPVVKREEGTEAALRFFNKSLKALATEEGAKGAAEGAPKA